MIRTYIILCLLSSCCVVLCQTKSKCKLPPEFWCSSKEIAADCEVTEQCERYFNQPAKKVDFTLYFESLCPDCKNFFSKQLGIAYDKVGDIMNITLVPFGNAEERKVKDKWEFSCQHGKEECVGNLIETCAISLLKNISVYFPFVFCMEHDKGSKPEISAQECAKEQGINLDPIMKCAKGDMGNQLEHQMAVKTNALNPKHKYVPWVTINGVHTEELEKKAENNLIQLICDTYTGSSKPAACTANTSRSYRLPTV